MSKFADLVARSGIPRRLIAKELGVCERTIKRYETGETKPKARDIQVIRGLISADLKAPPNSDQFRFIDLFAGIGGLRRGFESIGGKCVFTSEWDRYAQATYKANFACEHEVAGDITQIEADDIPEHDVLLAGFPCQPFSIAGVSKKKALKRPTRSGLLRPTNQRPSFLRM